MPTKKNMENLSMMYQLNCYKGLPVKEVNYIIFIQIKDELWLREMFNKAYRKEM